jgi:hypothetical protein
MRNGRFTLRKEEGLLHPKKEEKELSGLERGS